MEYNSDTELNATDTLRCESDSEEEDQQHLASELPEIKATEESVEKDEKINNTFNELATREGSNDSSDGEDKIGKRTDSRMIRKSKFSNIVNSESDEDAVPLVIKDKTDATQSDKTHINRLKSLLDSDSSEQEDDRSKKKAPQLLTKSKSKKSSKEKTLLDSDSSGKEDDDDDENKASEIQTKRKSKKSNKELLSTPDSDSEGDDRTAEAKKPSKERRKRKKDTKTEGTSTEVRTAQDILASLNLFFDDDDDDVAVPVTAKPKYSRSGVVEPGVYSSSEEESTESLMRSSKPARKMTAQQAMEDKQIIQSESQRMAREKYIDVPYHRTKAFSYEEFRARKTICRPDPARDCKGNIASANKSIRMTAEQLEEFARQLEERELESQNFFKSESESADSEPEKEATAEDKVDERQDNVTMKSLDTEDQEQVQQIDANAVVAAETTQAQSSPGKAYLETDNVETPSEEQIDSIDEIVNQTSDNVEQMITSFNEVDKTSANGTERVEINYDLFSNESSSGTPLAAKKATLLANLKLPPCPKLSGSSDMLIDLDSGILQPKEASGADILFQRLVKCSGSSQKPATPTAKAVSILSTEHGKIKLDTVTLFSNEERPLVNQEPIPGAAFLKLKQVLKEKIDNNRREFIRKREAEFAKKMELERAELGEDNNDEEEEDIELLEDDEEEDGAESEDDGTDNAAGGQKSLLDDKAMEEGMSETDENASSDEEDDDEDEDDEKETVGGSKKTGRIIKAFEDTDDEDQSTGEEPNQSIEIEPAEIPPTAPSSEGLLFASETEMNKKENEENMTLLWKDDEHEDKHEEEDDLMALCSGQFATQLPTQKQSTLSEADNHDDGGDVSLSNAEPLYTQNQKPLRESQLMDLCSGRFETQMDETCQVPCEVTKQQALGEALNESDTYVGGRLRLDSSDEETMGTVESKPKQKIKKLKRKKINISDDEDEAIETGKHTTSDLADGNSDAGDQEPDQEGDEADEEGERYVDYDSEENEVEVRLTKKEKELMSAKFVENEAELSESEWGSADEDEKDLDRYDVEVGDEEQYDQEQLQQELEKIHNRQMLDQDDREVEQLKEFFLEDEENDGVGRVRQFRWKNVEKTFSLDYDKTAAQDGDADGNGSDEETELNWRKMRHERNVLLKEQNIDLSSVDLTATTLLNPADTTVGSNEQENVQTPGGKKKITIIKKSSTSSTVVKEDNPFLISNSSILQGHRASFLSRDQETLNKLANLIPETEGATSSVLTAKARNFVFATLSPAVEKVQQMSSKRSLDSEDVEINANSKKAKTAIKEIGSKKKILLDSLP